MGILVVSDLEDVRKIMVEYEDSIDTMTDPLSFQFYSHVPSIYDVINAFEHPTEEACMEIIRVMNQHHIFFRLQGEYRYAPIEEVW